MDQGVEGSNQKWDFCLNLKQIYIVFQSLLHSFIKKRIYVVILKWTYLIL
jgi:hypothetical protein